MATYRSVSKWGQKWLSDCPKKLNFAEWCAAILLLAVCLALHVVVLDRAGPLWRDEVCSIDMAIKPWREMWRVLHFDSFPIGYYAIVRAWISLFGQTDESVRFFGMLCGVSLVAACWIAGRRLAVHIPFLTLIFCAISPLLVFWGDSIRAYGIGTACALMLVGAYWLLSQSTNTWRLISTTVLSILAVNLLWSNPVVVASAGMAAAAVAARNRRWRDVYRILAAGAVTALSLLVYSRTLYLRSTVVDVINRAGVSWSDIWTTMVYTLGGNNEFMFCVWLSILALGILVAISGQFQVSASQAAGRSEKLLFAAVFLVLVVPLFAVFLKMAGAVPKEAYFFAAWLPSTLLLDCILMPMVLRHWFLRLLQIGFVAAVILTLTPSYWNYVHMRHSNIKNFADFLEANAADGDLIVVNPWWYAPTFRHYYHGRIPWIAIPDFRDKSIYPFDAIKEAMTSVDPCRREYSEVEATLRNGHSVWLVGGVWKPPSGTYYPTLTPAPDPVVGWNIVEYSNFWDLQLGRLLSAPGLSVTGWRPPSDVAFTGYEQVPLARVFATRAPG